MLNLIYRELNYKTNLKYTLDFSQTDAQIEPYKTKPNIYYFVGGFAVRYSFWGGVDLKLGSMVSGFIFYRF